MMVNNLKLRKYIKKYCGYCCYQECYSNIYPVMSLRENIFLTIGSPLVDIIATIDDTFLNTFNLIPDNATLFTDAHENLFEQLKQYHPLYQSGGCALNAARALQWCLKIPLVCIVLGSIGNDFYGDILKKQLNEEKVNYEFEEIVGEKTGKCAVLLMENTRSLCMDLGASKFYTSKHLENKRIWNQIENAQYYYAPSFFFGVSAECLMKIAVHSLENGKTFALNLSAPFLMDIYKTQMDILLPYVDILFGNEAEARAFAKARRLHNDDLPDILLFINNLPKRNPNEERLTIITRGPHPVCLVQGTTIKEYPVGKPTKITDTNGAGDAFVGGFMAGFIMKNSMDVCVAKGIFVASKIIENVGCSF